MLVYRPPFRACTDVHLVRVQPVYDHCLALITTTGDESARHNQAVRIMYMTLYMSCPRGCLAFNDLQIANHLHFMQTRTNW